MPIRIKNGLPVKEKLERENLFVIDEKRAIDQDIRPLEICILNLMPTKEETELQLLRMLSNTPLQINVTFMRMSSHQSVNVSASHLMHFYHGSFLQCAPAGRHRMQTIFLLPLLFRPHSDSRINESIAQVQHYAGQQRNGGEYSHIHKQYVVVLIVK